MAKIKIGKRFIGDNEPCFFIAEAGINHNGSIQIAKQLINIASDAKADAVKFQKRDLTSLYPQKLLDNPLLGERSSQYLLEHLKLADLSDGEFVELANYANEHGIIFLCTPWDKKSVDFLDQIGVMAFKTGSPDLTNLDLLGYIASKRKPMIVSTGMSTFEEIKTTVEFLEKLKAKFALLHCCSIYPAPFFNINLRFMIRLKKEFDVVVGYSGHEEGIAVSEVAVALGASIIERHFTIDRTLPGPDHAMSLEPVGLKKQIRDIRQIEMAMGTGKKWLTRGEFMNREALGKSLFAARSIKKSQVITKEMVVVKGPGKGLSPQRIFDLVGLKAKRNITKDTEFLDEDIEQNVRVKLGKTTKNWAIPIRLSDLEEILKLNTKTLEFHLTDYDLDHSFHLSGKYNRELIVHCPEYRKDYLIDLASPEEYVRKISIETINKTIRIAKKAVKHFVQNGKTKVVVHPGGMFKQFATTGMEDSVFIEPSHKELIDRINAGLAILDDDKVEVLLENMPPLPWYFAGQWRHTVFLDPDEILDFCQKNERRICLDVSHAALFCNFKHFSLNKYIEILLPYTAHVHISDAAGIDGEGLPIGEGEIDFKQVFKALESYQEAYTVEIWQGHKFGGLGFIKSINTLEKILRSI